MAYDKAYLNEIVETQGELFGNIDEYIKGLDIYDFIYKYMNGRTRAAIDQGQAYVATMSSEDLWEYFKRVDHYIPQKGESIGGFAPDWVGRFYAYYQWFYDIPSSQTVKDIPVDFIMIGYRGLHDLDLELAVKKVHEQIEKKFASSTYRP